MRRANNKRWAVWNWALSIVLFVAFGFALNDMYENWLIDRALQDLDTGGEDVAVPLWQLQPKSVLPTIDVAFHSEVRAKRVYATGVLSQMWDARAKAAVRQLRHDPDPHVSSAARWGIENFIDAPSAGKASR